ncbi:MAG: cation diffusion facilitator family transporter [Microcella pacifica]|uniref:Cation transporter n=1 Tax=Microcella pacifica TaxID=2591847 RepID=A0A9E5JMK8_9MICO|nr:cation diffusion facilitator family transporter [Microcella pacifica]MBR22266.1 cation transporter [Leifsonia sp.]MBU1250632.1 cation diffusion facilitator family transporter [Actinomycetota bacterium]MBU1607830.1 cation diffusion facilitator family transporter [Actinomycetota bacterium]MBU2314684.1 cation diffusion facilitator family transporter [Actinomycetota bacterium]MBU2385645.1 cation diffusion facilitator family transporter [Actinomycetota bacterium]
MAEHPASSTPPPRRRGHDHAHSASRSRLLAAMAIVAVVLVVQLVGAVLTGSLALAADSGHVASDLVGLIVALIALTVARRPATERQTYGYRRAEVFGAALNAGILLAVAALVAVEATSRLLAPEAGEVQSLPMLLVAVAGLLGNIAGALLLRGEAQHSLNMRGAYLEVLGDLLGSLAVIAAAGVILLTGWAPADAVASLVIVAMIVPRALVLLRDVLRVLSQAAPPETSIAEIREHVLAAPGVVGVHDVHVWSITSGASVFSAHVVVRDDVFDGDRASALLAHLDECLDEHFDVAHSTFQLEPQGHERRESVHP